MRALRSVLSVTRVVVAMKGNVAAGERLNAREVGVVRKGSV